ncbi:hypothetical protein GWG54_19355 [Natronococcus sp. JC468]|uniref:hypothetical protein n=1 Tax=Natronococcus sp. JC468 TaxID=1961921 RepID=UPI00143C3ADE|nr:hypothetical protein [Natronococcus sp. JC468]NKE37912.1 hypothetical protein [Natronococcus sp. JC468]
MPTDFSDPDLVVKIDPFNQNERELFCAHERVPALQIKYSDSHWLLNNRDQISELIGPDQRLILTEWEDGDKLLERDPDDVFVRLMELEDYVDIAYLGDRWTYEAMTARQNRKQIMRSIEAQEYLFRRFEEVGADLELRPTILGWKSWHLERNRPLVDLMGGPVGFDATGYRSKYELAKDVNRVVEVLDVEVYVNGRIGPTHLEYLPSEVCGFSGKSALLKETKVDGEFSRDLLHSSIEKRLRAANDSQTELRQFFKPIAGD